MRKFLASFIVLFFVGLSLFGYVNPDYKNPVINVVNATADAVVKIDVEKTVSTSVDPFMEEFFKRFFGEQQNPFGTERKQTSLGSGFLFDSDGHILTNEHVVRGAETIKVTMFSGKTYDAEYIGGDSEMDIAIIKIKHENGSDFPFLEFGDSDNLQIGQVAIAIGNPLGFQHTVTTGVVSATERQIPKPDNSGYYTNLIQTDAAINPGNSGGPLLNIHGEVIGINTAIVNPTSGTNLGFAIPINDVNLFIEDLIKYGKLQKPQIGVKIMNIDENTKEALNLDSTEGAIVVEVSPNSPADKAGIKPQDIILEFLGEEVKNKEQLASMIRKQEIGKTATIKIDRNGEIIILEVELLAPDEQETTEEIINEPEKISNEISSELLGLSVSELTDTLRSEYKIASNVKGVFISDVANSSLAYRMGLRRGAVLLSINRQDISTTADFQETVSKLKKGQSVALYVYIPGEGSLMLSFPLQ